MHTTTDNNSKKTIPNNRALHPLIKQLLSKRNISPSEYQRFFTWDFSEMADFLTLKDLSKSSRRIVEAIQSNQRIGVYGDYDVDGTTSCALLWHFFQMAGVEVEVFQPSRFVEGYGIHNSSIDLALEKNIDVLITVDCGISNCDTAEYAKDKLDLIITDHHKDATEKMPEAFAIINPNRRDEDLSSELCGLAGVGVAFALCVQIRKDLIAQNKMLPSLYPLLQFVAIGTIADLAPLNATNRILVKHGLKQMPKTEYAGIKVFLSAEEIASEMIDSEKISFNIGPMINSKGRLDHPEMALKLLISEEYQQAILLYRQLEAANNERKKIQAAVFNEAKEQVITHIQSEDPLISIVYQAQWHEGVIGIVASKLVESFEVPAIVFTDAEEEGIIKASARTAGSLDLFNLLDQNRDLFLKFGGHKAAAGLSMKKENLNLLKQRLQQQLSQIPRSLRVVEDQYDLQLSFRDINASFMQAMEELAPFGQGNPRPVFRMQDFIIDHYKILKDVHVKWGFKGIREKNKLGGISFNYVGKWQRLAPEELLTMQQKQQLIVQFQLGINRFRGNKIIQLMVDKFIH